MPEHAREATTGRPVTCAPVDALAGLIVGRATAASSPRPVVLLDGRSGAGKTTLTRRIVDRWPGPVQVVHLDDVYPGWHGLELASRAVEQEMFAPDLPGWTSWDWELGRPGPRRRLDATLPLVVEGVGALTRRSAPAATVSVWLDLEDDERRQRALARDGDGYEPWWRTWAAQEDAHVRREDPVRLALVVARLAGASRPTA